MTKSKITSFDIEPRNEKIQKADFLNIDLKPDTNLVTIGNSPFGYKFSLAIKFINHSSLFSNIIAFVLPLQFQRWNVQKQINPNLKLIFESNWLPKNSFTYKGKKYPDKCGLGTASFNVWIKNVTKEI